MGDTVSRQLADLRGLAETLNRESDSLTNQIVRLEAGLSSLRLGLLVEAEDPIREWWTSPTQDSNPERMRTFLGFGKVSGQWRLYVQHHDDGGMPVSEKIPLKDATREDRIAAAAAFPRLLEAFKQGAAKAVAEIREATANMARPEIQGMLGETGFPPRLEEGVRPPAPPAALPRRPA